MKEKKVKKTLIEPKVRLLLWIHLHGVKDESNYLAKLAKKIDYSEGSIKSHLISDLLESKLIESLNPDKESPPYRTTREAKKLLEPIFLIRTIGLWFAIFVTVVLLSLFWYIDRPALLVYWYLPCTVVGFVVLVVVLILYPQILLKFGKTAFPKSD